MIYMCISYILAFFVVNDDSPIEPPGLKERRKNGERRESAVGVGVVMSQGRGERQGRLIPSTSSFYPHLSTFICRAIVLCLFNTSTV